MHAENALDFVVSVFQNAKKLSSFVKDCILMYSFPQKVVLKSSYDLFS